MPLTAKFYWIFVRKQKILQIFGDTYQLKARYQKNIKIPKMKIAHHNKGSLKFISFAKLGILS